MPTLLSSREEQIVNVLVGLKNNATFAEILAVAAPQFGMTGSNVGAVLCRLHDKGVIRHTGAKRHYRYRVQPIPASKEETEMPRAKRTVTAQAPIAEVDTDAIIGKLVERLEAQAVEIAALRQSQGQLQRQIPQLSPQIRQKLRTLGVLR